MPPNPETKIDSSPETVRILDEIEKQFELDDTKLHAILDRFIEEFDYGLSNYGHPMAMIPTFVTGVPTGEEVGTFLALDLGGTNLRVCEVKLESKHKFTLRQQKYQVSDSLKTGDAKILFDFLADSVSAFLTSIDSQIEGGDYLPLGFTFSFPVEQTALDQGTLLTWTKGFSATGAQGKDVVRMLQDAFDRKRLHVKCVALVNDTVGTLLSRSYLVGGCLVGCIYGTGTNAAYLDEVSAFRKLPVDARAEGGKMVVNTEWGAFDNARNVLPFTEYDNKLDRESINPRKQAFEKLISGMYQGEIIRNIIRMIYYFNLLIRPPNSSPGYSTPSLNAHYGFDTALMSDIERDPDHSPEFFTRARKVFTHGLGFAEDFEFSDTDFSIVRWACRIVATRAAKLSGIGLAAIVKKTNAPEKTNGDIHVGVDGSVAEHYPQFEERARVALTTVLGKEVEQRIKIGLAKDGSGVGAALCALQATKDKASQPALTQSRPLQAPKVDGQDAPKPGERGLPASN
ncbi:hexokinase-domain-containing protein [Cantharellus anzutake]|uniref:hexokinase-domain-containing protein n=1 Tax=Cantharellus anzutake TaxID=1750568 RepID=UPI001906454E|nr:hexokinase-domain-containing protein [Cantharellus anzutake]KAF8324483.1 hexokinase-domain-containing protein [Cantharellus anzutake]